MKLKIISFAILFAICALALSIGIKKSYASAYGSCELEVSILNVEKPAEHNKKYKVYEIKTEFELIKIDNIKGHSGGTMQCRAFKKGDRVKATLYADSKEKADKVKKGEKLLIKYQYISGFNRKTGKSIRSVSYTIK